MGASRHQLNKPHKTRFASKSSRNVHKVSSQDIHKVSKSDGGIAKGAKAARLQRNKMMREQKRAAILKEKRTSSPFRVIVLFGLSACVNLDVVEKDIQSLLTEEGNTTIFPAFASSEYKVLKAPHGDLVKCMKMAKDADFLAFVASSNSLREADGTNSYIDSFGSQCLSWFRTHSLSSTAVLIRDLPEDLKRKHEIKKMRMSLAPEFPKDCKFYTMDEKDELHKLASIILKEKRTPSPPQVVVLFGLSACVNLNALEEDIQSLLCEEGNTTTFPAISSSEYKLRTTVLKAPHGDLVACMEMAKVADLLAFVASPNSLHEAGDTNSFIDSFGSQCLSVFRTLGLPSTAVLIRDLPKDMKRKHEIKKMCMSMLAPEFPEDCKFYPVDKKDELHKFMWLFTALRLAAPHWRNQRSYLMAQKIEMEADDISSSEKCTLVLTGYIRAHSLSVNQLVHVAGAGDFPLSKIELLKDPCPLNLRKGEDLMDSENDTQVVTCLTPDPEKQEPLVVENSPDILAGEQTWPTEAEMAEADRNHKDKKMKKKRLPRGISEYQAAWIVDDLDVDFADSEGEDDGMVVDGGEIDFLGQKLQNEFDFDDDQASVNLRDSDEETKTESVMMDGDELTKEQIAEQIRKIKEERAKDEEFPDEVDTPIDVAARKRFAKYRGVNSFRTSTWDPKESLPPDYSRIFTFDNFVVTQKHAKALDMLQVRDGCIPAGSYTRLYIKDVSAGVASKLCTLSKRLPVIACGLLQHESKISVLDFSIKKHDSYDAPIKAKEELLFHVGFRQFTSRPIFSSDSINASKHKMERFLHAGRFSVASTYAPICFHSLPLIALKSQGEDKYPVVAAVGSLRSVDPDRIVLKKIILTGYPQRVSKTKATVRYMFHNPEDVRWFKPVEVWSKCGRRGRIREPVGTHGAMKCIFNGVLQQHDTVCMSLFKRSYPKWPQQWFPLNSGSD